jgi:hypothetical protein
MYSEKTTNLPQVTDKFVAYCCIQYYPPIAMRRFKFFPKVLYQNVILHNQFYNFVLDFGTVLTVWHFFFFFHFNISISINVVSLDSHHGEMNLIILLYYKVHQWLAAAGQWSSLSVTHRFYPIKLATKNITEVWLKAVAL